MKMEVNRNCPNTPSIEALQAPIFTPGDRSTLPIPNVSSAESNPSIYALNITNLTEVQTPLNSLSVDEQLRRERDIAHQSSVITRDSFISTYSSLQTMLSQMQLKVAAAFIQETEYLQQREQRLEHEEQLLCERSQQLETLRCERKRMEDEFGQIKDRLECAVIQVKKFKTDGVDAVSRSS